MGLQYRSRRSIGHGMHVNLSKSGISLSKRVGPVTFNSRGSLWVRLGRGFFWRSR